MWWRSVVGTVILGTIIVAFLAASVEQPPYIVRETRGEFEVRDYPSLIVAETVMAGERSQAASSGYRLIADYLFGDNTAGKKLALTAPLMQLENDQLKSLVPDIKQSEGHAWIIRMMVPSGQPLEALPKPKNPAVKLKILPARRMAVSRFSGDGDTASFKRHEDRLQSFIQEQELTSYTTSTYALYSSPWMLSMFRRNEVMVEIAQSPRL